MIRAAQSWLLCLLLGAASACRDREPLKLGFVSGLTGRHSDLGISSRNGATLAVTEINGAGGVKGRQLQLEIRDDAQDPEQARRAVRELVDSGVVAMIGHATSSMAAATLSIVNDAQVLMVSPTATSPDFTGGDDWFVRLMSTNDASARRIADAAVDRLRARRVAVIVDMGNASFSLTYSAAFRRALEARGGVAFELPFHSGGHVSFGHLAQQALAGGADAVLVVAGALDAAAAFQQLRKRSAAVHLLGCDWAFTQEVLAEGGVATEGALFPQSVNLMDPEPRFRRFARAYEERFHRPPDFAAVVSYEAVQLLAEALRRATTRREVRDAVLGVGTFQGLQGPIQLDRFGNARRRIFLFTVENGRMVPLQ